ncbi:DUF2809 domain-containing protein [Leptolyngbya ohadii]|uniref:ribosomal maturation YjgA family protein n=1 Tax=Leptolyngbya ohadii TaxID=1962290 RepID=UPI0019D48712|nr:DUF2809 domain-containing protein [Leptolyngbya ohadii]
MPAKNLLRYRIRVMGIASIVILLGLLSRSPLLPPTSFLGQYSGDILWAMLVYLLVRWLLPQQSILRSAMYAGLFALAIEVSQLYHAPWIDAIRHTQLGGLILGFGFLRSDLICYAVGISMGVYLERVLLQKQSQK